MKVIGLTGGIGSGKSTVSKYLMSKGYEIVDADQIARELVAPHSETLERIQTAFGKDILLNDNSLNRKALADIIFSDPEKKKQLDEIMHHEIIRIIRKRLDDARAKSQGKAVFVDAPLLFEVGLEQYVEQTWVVDASDEVRINRVVERDQTTRAMVRARIDNQMSREEKNQKADIVLDNSTTKEKLYEQIENLLLQLE
ncbi:dephospho-CoA kinase [Clostridium aminobutyricum]|uniref:Dephospho-CoA kinase n=1 Tax=Clostridium aminobutyricum TaxID=33953 RepID=A0A939D7C3_CLOAM|nr:dephospho-CoA kinase [Clostridium aminobutyricum]MBN7772431.1 dephospho-CoA kinase [Clostridium aminobutyricum]